MSPKDDNCFDGCIFSQRFCHIDQITSGLSPSQNETYMVADRIWKISGCKTDYLINIWPNLFKSPYVLRSYDVYLPYTCSQAKKTHTEKTQSRIRLNSSSNNIFTVLRKSCIITYKIFRSKLIKYISIHL